ncbi:MAG: DUF883 C-terminal domain-containing protein [Pirellulales bacterium]
MVANSQTMKKDKDDLKSEIDDVVDQGKKLTDDVVEYLTEYARENPGTAALVTLGVGFILGWKLKPW